MGSKIDRLNIISMNSAGRNGVQLLDFRRIYHEEVLVQHEPDLLLLPSGTPDIRKHVVMNYEQFMANDNKDIILLYDPKRLRLKESPYSDLKLPNVDSSKLIFPTVEVLAAPPMQTIVKQFQCVTWHYTLSEAPSDQRYKQGQDLMLLAQLLAWLTGTGVLLGGDFNLPLEQIQTLIKQNNRLVQKGLNNAKPFFRQLGFLDSMTKNVLRPERMLRKLKLHQCKSVAGLMGNPNYFIASEELQLLETSVLKIESSTGKFTALKALEHCPPPTKTDMYIPSRPPRYHDVHHITDLRQDLPFGLHDSGFDASDIACNWTQDTWSPDITFLGPSLIRTHIKEKGNQSKEINRLLQWICSRVESSVLDVLNVWPGYMVDDFGEPVFVAIVDEKREDNPMTFDTFKLLVRKDSEVSDEAKYVVKLEQERNCDFTEEERSTLQSCLTKHTSGLMKKHSNLSIVSASKLKSRKYGTDEAITEETTCIVFYVHVKGVIPFDEDPFPSDLDGFPTDVREGLFYPYSNPREYHEHLMMGCQIGTAYGTCGSLGAFVELSNGSIGCLTSWHMFVTEESRADYQIGTVSHSHFKRDVFQPASGENSKIGHLLNAFIETGDENNIGVDAALIEITDMQRHPQNGHFPEAVSERIGFSMDKPMVFNSGKVVKAFSEVPRTYSVVKYGCSTGHTRGKLRLAGPAVQKNKFSYTIFNNPRNIQELHQQFEVEHIQDEPFSDLGDSGSLVFLVKDDGDDYDVTALGLLVGATTHNTTIVTPIWAVLEKFGLPLQLLPFGAVANTGAQADTSESIRLGVLERDMTSVKSDIETLKVNVANVQQDIISVKSEVASVKSDITSVKTDFDSLKTAVSRIDTKLDQFQTTGDSIQSQVASNHASIQASMQSQMAEMRNFFQAMLMPRQENVDKGDKDSNDL